jgi:hypothetical protein
VGELSPVSRLRIPTPLLLIALLLGTVAVAWGLAALWWAVVPGPSGEWIALAQLAATMVDLPVGLLVLILALPAEPRYPGLRRWALITAVMALALPLVIYLVLHSK